MMSVSSCAPVRLPAGEVFAVGAGSRLHLTAGCGAAVGFLPQQAEFPGLAVMYALPALFVVIFLLLPQ